MFEIIGYFFSMVMSGAFYVLLAYIFKFKQGKAETEDDPWAKKDARDFLEFMHAEQKDFARHGGFFVMNVTELVMLSGKKC